MLADFKGLGTRLVESAESLRRTNVGIQSEVENALIQLQYRTSQMLTHVRASITKTGSQMVSGDTLDVDFLIKDMESSYAMAEERSNHNRKETARPAVSGEVTFF